MDFIKNDRKKSYALFIEDTKKFDFLNDRKKLYALFLVLDAYFNSKYCKTMDFAEFCEFLNKKMDEMDDENV